MEPQQPIQTGMPQMPESEQGHGSYVKIIVGVIILVAVLAAAYVIGMGWIKTSGTDTEGTMQENSLTQTEEEGGLADIEASLEAMDFDNTEQELQTIDREFQE